MVQDPNFWRRFSIAVHNDEAAMLALEEGTTGKKETKHAYVVSLSSPLQSSHLDSPITTPTSQCHLSPAFPSKAFTRPVSAPASALAPCVLKLATPEKRSAGDDRKSKISTKSVVFTTPDGSAEMLALHALPSNKSHSPSTPHSTHFPPSKRSSRHTSRRTSLFRFFALSSHPPSLPPTPKTPTFAFPNSSARTSRLFPSQKNTSRLSLGISLSGRPRSGFRFWTTVTAGADSHSPDHELGHAHAKRRANTDMRSEDWLASQHRKARQRTWMCWFFWVVMIFLVTGVVVTVVVLRGKGII